MNRLSTEQRVRIIGCLVEATRSTPPCADRRGEERDQQAPARPRLDALGLPGPHAVWPDLPGNSDGRDLVVRRLQEGSVKPEHSEDWGDAWTFVGIDPDVKLVRSRFVGQPCAEDAYTSLTDRPAGPAGQPE